MLANNAAIAATSVQITTTGIEQLDIALVHLQASAADVSMQMRLSNKAHYEHLAVLYLWWREANQIPHYLDDTYAKAGIRYKKNTSQAINFTPLFKLTWGVDELTYDKTWRWSRVLNQLHAIYEAEPEYRIDSAVRLADYIAEKRGVDGIVGCGCANDDDAPDDDGPAGGAAARPAVSQKNTASIRLPENLYGKAVGFLSGSATVAPLFNLDTPIPLTDNMGVVLIAKVGNQYRFVHACNDPQYVQQAVADAYLQDYAALPPSIRMIMEIISTQCLPEHLQKLHPKLLDRAVSAKAKAINRLMYCHANDEWVLSPVDAHSGVVTIATPFLPVLENATNDTFLLQQGRRKIERHLISPRKFNLYAASSNDAVPASNQSGYVTHSLRLQHLDNSADALNLHFLPFGSPMSDPRGQLMPAIRKVLPATWRAKLNRAWFNKFALEFTGLWFGNIAKHLTRKPNKVFSLEFSGAGLSVGYSYINGKFEIPCQVPFDAAVTMSNPLSVYVRSQDFSVAMQAVSELSVTSSIDIEVDADTLVLRFSTTAATYRIYLPTCTVEGDRNSAGFTQYEPALINIAAAESYIEQIAGELSVQAEQP